MFLTAPRAAAKPAPSPQAFKTNSKLSATWADDRSRRQGTAGNLSPIIGSWVPGIRLPARVTPPLRCSRLPSARSSRLLTSASRVAAASRETVWAYLYAREAFGPAAFQVAVFWLARLTSRPPTATCRRLGHFGPRRGQRWARRVHLRHRLAGPSTRRAAALSQQPLRRRRPRSRLRRRRRLPTSPRPSGALPDTVPLAAVMLLVTLHGPRTAVGSRRIRDPRGGGGGGGEKGPPPYRAAHRALSPRSAARRDALPGPPVLEASRASASVLGAAARLSSVAGAVSPHGTPPEPPTSRSRSPFGEPRTARRVSDHAPPLPTPQLDTLPGRAPRAELSQAPSLRADAETIARLPLAATCLALPRPFAARGAPRRSSASPS